MRIGHHPGEFTSLPRTDRRPLSAHVVMHSRDLDESRELVQRIFDNEHVLQLSRPRGQVDARMHHVPIGRTSLSYFEYGDVLLKTSPLAHFLVHDPLDGASPMEMHGEHLTESPSLGAVINAGEEMRMQFAPNTRRLVARFDRQVLEQHLEHLLGQELGKPLAFFHAMPMDGAAGSAYRRMMRFLAGEIDRASPMLSATLTTSAVEQMLMTTLLSLQPHNYSKALENHDRPAMPYYVRRALEYIEEHADRPLTVTDLAAVTGVSGRSLQAGFRRVLATTPMGYLRRVRLEQVRTALRQADPATASVTDIATRWGFFHFGRFSEQYRRCYGERPSTTLRRS